ncbi:MAG: hypothetical protein AAF570_10045, partial [Bacteroidota bacterium]
QFVLGYTRSFPESSLRLRLEAYHQYTWNIPIDTVNGQTFTTADIYTNYLNVPLRFATAQRTFGADFILENTRTERWFWMLSASYVDARFRDLSNQWRNSPFNFGFIGNLMLGRRFALGADKRKSLSFYTRFVYRGGHPVTPIDLDASRTAGATVFFNDQLYEARLDDYFRPDLGIHFRNHKDKWAWILSLDIQNVISRDNEREQFYDFQTGEIGMRTHLGLIPILNY